MSDFPKLVMGEIVTMTPDGEEGIPIDDAVIHFEGDEDSEIEIHCPGALRLAPHIVKAVNNHDALVRRVAALELIIAEEVSPFDCRDDLNRMLVEEICNRIPGDVGSPVLTHEKGPGL